MSDAWKKVMADRYGKRNVLGMGLISLMNDVASEMIYPLLPVFLTGVLHAGAAAIGIIEGVAETTVSLIKYFSGLYSDRLRRRKPVFAFGYGIANVVRPLVGIATSWQQVLLVRFADRVGKGVRSAPRDALLADSVEKENLGLAFGFQRTMDHVGALTGPLIAAGLLYLGLTLRSIFLLTIIPGAITVILALCLVKERAHAASGEAKAISLRSVMEPGFLWYLATVAVFTLGNSTDAFLLLKAQKAGVSVAMLPILWAMLHFSKAAFSMPGGYLSDRLGRKPVIILGWLAYALVYAGFAYAGSGLAIWSLFFAYGLYFGLCEGVEKAFVADLMPAHVRGSAYGAYALAVSITALPASVIFGLVWQSYGDRTAFIMGSGLALAASLMLLFVRSGRGR
jgi:MFS family permease